MAQNPPAKSCGHVAIASGGQNVDGEAVGGSDGAVVGAGVVGLVEGARDGTRVGAPVWWAQSPVDRSYSAALVASVRSPLVMQTLLARSHPHATTWNVPLRPRVPVQSLEHR